MDEEMKIRGGGFFCPTMHFKNKVKMWRVKSTLLDPQIQLGEHPVPAITTAFQFQLARMRPPPP